MPTQDDLVTKTLGERTVTSPLHLSTARGQLAPAYVPDGAGVLLDIETTNGVAPPVVLFERAGPREKIFFDPAKTRAGIVTCGGLCPGVNNVVCSMVLELFHKYGVKSILGFRYGFMGIDPAGGMAPMPLGPDDVRTVHKHGGSFLGTSRGAHDPKRMVDALERHGVDVLFAIGGDGTLRGAHAIHEECARRGRNLAVVAVPKTIDNDVAFVDKTFGYDTAVEVASSVIDAAHSEAIGAYNGVGIVKLMGRDSGFIAAAATLASREVNYCLVPEVPFELGGEHGLLASLERRLLERHHAVVVVAEGCAASLVGEGAERDASGNVRYAAGGVDVGPRLRDAIAKHMSSVGMAATIKYIDPSYVVRGVPANAQDAVFCDALARNAVHAGMAGKTDVVIGRLHRVFTHVPLPIATSRKKRIDPDGGLWLAVTEATGQPRFTR